MSNVFFFLPPILHSITASSCLLINFVLFPSLTPFSTLQLHTILCATVTVYISQIPKKSIVSCAGLSSICLTFSLIFLLILTPTQSVSAPISRLDHWKRPVQFPGRLLWWIYTIPIRENVGAWNRPLLLARDVLWAVVEEPTRNKGDVNVFNHTPACFGTSP